MSEQAPRRRLAAILAADVVGYSRMMQADEAGTLAALKSRRTEILQPLVSKHHGRIIKVMGDRVLVEFASAVQAVSCAVALQEAMAVANEAAEESRRVVLRIGINLSDVMVEGGDLYGDGVNIASRLEGMAEPGGIWVSGKVREEAAGKIGCEFVDLGEQTLKNIAGPVRAYRIQLRGSAVPAPAAVTLPEKPSIAVLPLVNMSGDHEQEFFADGLTEDIITALSRISGLWVIARTSTSTYKGKPADVKQVARELGVRYVMEGSVRRSGQHLRVTTQLVDAATGHHVWAERYDRTVADLFEIQDDITRGVAATTETQVYLAERTAPALSPSAQLTARDLVARAMARTYDQTPEALAEASSLVEEALRADARDATWAEPKIVCKALDARRIGLEPGVLAKLLPHISVATVMALGFGSSYVLDRQLLVH
jgi:TolB-like protein